MKKIEKLNLKKWEANVKTVEVPTGKLWKHFFGQKYEEVKMETEGIIYLKDTGKIFIEIISKINEIIDILNEKKGEK
jgi:hypothetical protein